MSDRLPRNFGLDLVRATEAAALAAGRWMGLRRAEEADSAAVGAMHEVLDGFEMDGHIVVGEEGRLHACTALDSGCTLGQGRGPQTDVVVDPIDGRNLLAFGRPGAISVAAVAPRDSIWSAAPTAYMEKMVVDQQVGRALVPECMDAPVAWTLALIARLKGKEMRDLLIFVLDRPRHSDLIESILRCGARIMLSSEGDIAGALMAALPSNPVDIMLGIGGAAEGVIAACAVKAMRGAMLARPAPMNDDERATLRAAGPDARRVLTCDDLVTSDQVFFAATGITDGPLLQGVHYRAGRAESNSLILRCETGTRRLVQAEHLLEASTPAT